MSIKVKKGSVLVYRMFDIAEEVDMQKAEALLRDSRGQARFKVPKYIDRALIMKAAPVTFGYGEVDLQLKRSKKRATVSGKIRDYGVLSLVYQIPIEPGTDWDELIRLAADLEEGSEVDQIASVQSKAICDSIRPALKQHSEWNVFEDYILYFLEEIDGASTGEELLKRADIPSLLLAEDDIEISAKTREAIMGNTYQYSDKDLTLIEWNAALVLEPGGGREVPDIIEFAVSHLMEMRYYDDLLDKRLALLYDDIEKNKGSFLRSHFAQIYQDASSRYIEFSEFTERVENSLKVVGDFYLATVYRAATKRFRLADWQQNIMRKMNILAQVSSLLQGEVNARRSLWLEVTIILLIAFELISALANHW